MGHTFVGSTGRAVKAVRRLLYLTTHIFRRQVVQRNVALRRLIVAIECRFRPKWSMTSSVTRLGNLLDFEQLFKACGYSQFAQIYHILRQFLERCQNLYFSSKIILGNFYRHLAYFSGHTDDKAASTRCHRSQKYIKNLCTIFFDLPQIVQTLIRSLHLNG